MFLHDFAHVYATDESENWTPSGYRVETLLISFIGLMILICTAAYLDPMAIKAVGTATVAMSPVWIPLFLATVFWTTWIEYLRFQYLFRRKMVLLEVQLPPEVIKSPLAMELFLTALWNNGSETSFIQRIWKGQFRVIWTLEIASNEGKVSFYIHLPKDWRNIVEARLYGQFPEAKVTEAEDYTTKVHFNKEEYTWWGTEYKKSKAGAVPIKTYVDYALDKNPDTPEIQVDPLTNILEYMSSIGQGEYVWLQFIIKARKADEWYGFYKSKDSYKEGGKKEIADMMAAAGERAKKLVGDDPEKQAQAQARGLTLLTEVERRKVEAIERAMSKLLFECGIRSMYIVKKERFQLVNIGSLVRLFDPFRSGEYFNNINVTRGMSIFDYPWQDFMNIRRNKIMDQIMFYYRERAYFYVPYDQSPEFFNVEELASLWHFPNSLVNPPGLERVASKRAEAPSNLPTGPAAPPLNLPS
ncbi:MAG TPA: hypothetical protein VHD31_02715 [Candidatus Paceibacterota bacterium]|nr:hypothetical protein [Candidatus Paceibacterota bacterium]